MKFFLRAFVLLTALLVSTIGNANAEAPLWAYPVNPPGVQQPVDDGKPRRVPDSDVTFTQHQIGAISEQPPDWHADEHPAMPGIVGRSREPHVYACSYCHLPNGAGRPENANLAGLSANYIKEQLGAFRDGNRQGSEPARAPQTNMIAIAKALTDAEIEASAAYFASLAPVSYVKVVEASTVPKTTVRGWMLAKTPGNGTESIGNRVIEVAVDFERFENRDSRTPYIAYVPVGSIARGKDLVTTGGAGRTMPCAACHGSELKGMADVPRIAGRSPGYLFRQLYDIRGGTRAGAMTELMQPVVAGLTDEDMVAIAAYLASLSP